MRRQRLRWWRLPAGLKRNCTSRCWRNNRVLHLERGVPLRATPSAARHAPARRGINLLLLVAHHIVMDGWSLGLFLNELAGVLMQRSTMGRRKRFDAAECVMPIM